MHRASPGKLCPEPGAPYESAVNHPRGSPDAVPGSAESMDAAVGFRTGCCAPRSVIAGPARP
ncbi:hypothetical protein Slala03_17930 [Streptomyces lavendulae subsp. lavendulae]|nr:hypothetical protein Slala03_17930 [Streptomyces lavendulae subsp. lavendulae]